jgi:hypothetical protein
VLELIVVRQLLQEFPDLLLDRVDRRALRRPGVDRRATAELLEGAGGSI